MTRLHNLKKVNLTTPPFNESLLDLLVLLIYSDYHVSHGYKMIIPLQIELLPLLLHS
jgi:hypothetical protein